MATRADETEWSEHARRALGKVASYDAKSAHLIGRFKVDRSRSRSRIRIRSHAELRLTVY